MTINKKKIGIAAAAVALVGVAGIAIAKGADHYRDGRGFDGHFGFRGDAGQIARALDLNDEQREQTRAMMNDIRAFRRAHRESAHMVVAAAFTGESLSPADAEKILSMREQHRDEMRAFMGAKLSEFHAILTPAQRENAVALWQDRRHHRGWGRRGGRDNDRHRRGWGRDDDDDYHHRRRRDDD